MSKAKEYLKRVGLIQSPYISQERVIKHLEAFAKEQEEAITVTRCCTELPTSTQLLSDCKKRFKDLRANNYKFDYRSYLNGYLDSFSKYAVSKTK